MPPTLNAWHHSGPIPFRIRGDDIQTVEFLLTPGQRLTLQPHCFLAAAGGIRDLNISFGRRLMDPVLRMWSGESGILQEVVCEREPGRVIVGASQIGRIVRIPLRGGRSVICHRGAYVASTGEVDIGIAVTGRIRAGIFGGQGAVFQRLSGTGDVFLHACGDLIDWQLPGHQVVRVSTHNILAFEDTVGYDVQLAGGMFTLLIGNQGLFLSQLEGPGRVIIQSMALVDETKPARPLVGPTPDAVRP